MVTFLGEYLLLFREVFHFEVVAKGRGMVAKGRGMVAKGRGMVAKGGAWLPRRRTLGN